MDYKRLLSQVERTLAQIENAGTRRLTIEQIAETIATNFRDELGITGGRIYEATGENTYELVGRFGQSRDAPLGITVAKDYKPLELTLENGIVVMDPNDPGVDPVLEERLGAHRFAAIAAGDDNQHILGFDVSPELSREDILFSLNLVRYAINQRLRAERYESLIVEAASRLDQAPNQELTHQRSADGSTNTMEMLEIGINYSDARPTRVRAAWRARSGSPSVVTRR